MIKTRLSVLCVSAVSKAVRDWGEILNLWLETYQTTKDFKHRGIVEVKLA